MTNAPSTKMSVEDMIRHYQRSIERSQHDPKRIMHCISKLERMNVTVQHLQTTRIGRTINFLRKDDGEVGQAAKVLIAKWKDMVANEKSDGSEEEKPKHNYGYDEDEDSTGKVHTESINNSEKQSNKSHEHMSKSSSKNHHHHHHHHQDQNEHRSFEKIHDNTSHQRKYSSDDTHEHSAQLKHKHKSHSHNENHANSMKRQHETESNGNDDEIDRHKISSRHQSKEERHHRSRHETQHNGDEISDKKHKSSGKDKDKGKDNRKHSEHHKSHSSSNDKTHHVSNKSKRLRESDDPPSSSPKKQKRDSTSSSQSNKKKSSKSKFKHVDDGIEIDHSMGTSFADALGMLAPTPSQSTKSSTQASTSTSSKKSSSKTVSSASSSHNKSKIKDKPKTTKSLSITSTTTTETPSLLLKKPKLPPLEDLAKDLPPPTECIIPNDYKPSPINHMVMDCVFKGPKQQAVNMLSEMDSLCASTTSKNQRTKVYSGVKSGQLLTVPSLHELCIRFLQKNIDALEYTGGVPFEILKPILERANPDQLCLFEHYNPYLMEDSDILWQQHCQRNYKAKKRQEMETWREMFIRCKTEQEEHLKRLTRNINQSQSVALPVRKTQLAYVDSMVKPPRSIIKKQNQFGTSHKLIATPAARVDSLSSVATNITKVGDARLKTTASMRDTAQAQPSNGVIKPKKAPLMAKTLQLMKGRFKR